MRGGWRAFRPKATTEQCFTTIGVGCDISYFCVGCLATLARCDHHNMLEKYDKPVTNDDALQLMMKDGAIGSASQLPSNHTLRDFLRGSAR